MSGLPLSVGILAWDLALKRRAQTMLISRPKTCAIRLPRLHTREPRGKNHNIGGRDTVLRGNSDLAARICQLLRPGDQQS
jgi:hypothetical protein